MANNNNVAEGTTVYIFELFSSSVTVVSTVCDRVVVMLSLLDYPVGK